MTAKQFKQKRNKSITSDKNFAMKKVSPLTDHQMNVFESYESGKNVILHGCAGTGKTYLALYLAMRDVMSTRTEQDQVIVVRSAVPVRELGYLPGTEKEKTEVYETPYKSLCSELFSRDDAYQILKTKNQIKFLCTSFIRGITIRNAIVIVEEVQNMNFEEIHSIITRLGEGSRIIICGDTMQCDLYENKKENVSGISKLLKIANQMDEFDLINFDENDIVRSDIVASWIKTKLKLGIE